MGLCIWIRNARLKSQVSCTLELIRQSSVEDRAVMLLNIGLLETQCILPFPIKSILVLSKDKAIACFYLIEAIQQNYMLKHGTTKDKDLKHQNHMLMGAFQIILTTLIYLILPEKQCDIKELWKLLRKAILPPLKVIVDSEAIEYRIAREIDILVEHL